MEDTFCAGQQIVVERVVQLLIHALPLTEQNSCSHRNMAAPGLGENAHVGCLDGIVEVVLDFSLLVGVRHIGLAALNISPGLLVFANLRCAKNLISSGIESYVVSFHSYCALVYLHFV